MLEQIVKEKTGKIPEAALAASLGPFSRLRGPIMECSWLVRSKSKDYSVGPLLGSQTAFLAVPDEYTNGEHASTLEGLWWSRTSSLVFKFPTCHKGDRSPIKGTIMTQ